MAYLFVYGYLMRGCRQHNKYLSGDKYLGKAIIREHTLFDAGGFPVAVLSAGIEGLEGSDVVVGEVYEVPKERLEEIDIYEGGGLMFGRQLLEAEMFTKREYEICNVYCYIWNRSINGLEHLGSAWREKI